MESRFISAGPGVLLLPDPRETTLACRRVRPACRLVSRSAASCSDARSPSEHHATNSRPSSESTSDSPGRSLLVSRSHNFRVLWPTDPMSWDERWPDRRSWDIDRGQPSQGTAVPARFSGAKGLSGKPAAGRCGSTSDPSRSMRVGVTVTPPPPHALPPAKPKSTNCSIRPPSRKRQPDPADRAATALPASPRQALLDGQGPRLPRTQAHRQFPTLPPKTDAWLVDQIKDELALSDLTLIPATSRPRIENPFTDTPPKQAPAAAKRWAAAARSSSRTTRPCARRR
jgi:hypothetical protein